jgi:hypothetical protein
MSEVLQLRVKAEHQLATVDAELQCLDFREHFEHFARRQRAAAKAPQQARPADEDQKTDAFVVFVSSCGPVLAAAGSWQLDASSCPLQAPYRVIHSANASSSPPPVTESNDST